MCTWASKRLDVGQQFGTRQLNQGSRSVSDFADMGERVEWVQSGEVGPEVAQSMAAQIGLDPSTEQFQQPAEARYAPCWQWAD